MNRFKHALVLIATVFTFQVNAELLLNTGGTLVTGVNGIVIDGHKRQFDFVGGSYTNVFNEDIYAFNLDDVSTQLVDIIAESNQFTHAPQRISGCGFTVDNCGIRFPYTTPNIATPGHSERIDSLFVSVRQNGEPTIRTARSNVSFTSPFHTWARLKPLEVPEPSTLGLLVLGLLGLSATRYQRAKH